MKPRYQVYIATGDWYGRTEWLTTRTRWGAHRVVRRLNRSTFAEKFNYVFAARRIPRSRR